MSNQAASDDPVVQSRIVCRCGTPTGTVTASVHWLEATKSGQRVGEAPKVGQGSAALDSLAWVLSKELNLNYHNKNP